MLALLHYILHLHLLLPPTRPLLRMQIKEGVSRHTLITFISYCTHVQSWINNAILSRGLP